MLALVTYMLEMHLLLYRRIVVRQNVNSLVVRRLFLHVLLFPQPPLQAIQQTPGFVSIGANLTWDASSCNLLFALSSGEE